MVVYIPQHYGVIREDYNTGAVVPVPIHSDYVHFDVSDVWEEVRLVDRRHSSLFHVTLPESYVCDWFVPGANVAQLPVFEHRYRYSFVKEFPDVWDRWQTEYGTLFCNIIVQGKSCVTSVDLEFGREGGLWFVAIERNSYPILGYTGELAYPNSKTCKAYMSNWEGGRAYLVHNRADKPTLEEVVVAVQSYANCASWSDVSTDFLWLIDNPDPTDTSAVRRRIADELRANERFEERSLIRSTTRLVRKFSIRDNDYVDSVAEPPRTPLWIQSDADFIVGKARSYLSALEDFPRVSDNMIQNIASCLQALASFAFEAEATTSVFDDLVKACGGRTAKRGNEQLYKVDLPYIKEIGNGWLSQRYEITTSVMDGQQAWDYFFHKAQEWLGVESPDRKCHGQYSDGDVTFQCTFRMEEKAWTGLTRFFESCYREGLEPNAYVLWDFVPFSFIVDWFFPIGDALEAYTMASHYTPQYYTYLPAYGEYTMCYSVAYSFNTFFGVCHSYCRWYEAAPPNCETSYIRWKAPQSTKYETTLMRTLDGLCLAFL